MGGGGTEPERRLDDELPRGERGLGGEDSRTHLKTEEDNESADVHDVNDKPAEGALDRKISKAMEAMSEIGQGDSSWLKEEILSTFADPNSEGAAGDVVIRQKLTERVNSELRKMT